VNYTGPESQQEKRGKWVKRKKRSVTPFRFKQLWENHPVITGDKNPCSTNGKPNFSNQCAIRLGTALAACGVDTTKLPGVRHCWYHDKKLGHTLSAEELAASLKKYQTHGVGALQAVEPSEFAEKIEGKTGIIFFKDYWQRTVNGKNETFRNRSGDHIDLWNGSRITDWFSWMRIYMRIGNFGIHSLRGDISDYEESKAIWFWSVT
jgi:hypothetical protein